MLMIKFEGYSLDEKQEILLFVFYTLNASKFSVICGLFSETKLLKFNQFTFLANIFSL